MGETVFPRQELQFKRVLRFLGGLLRVTAGRMVIEVGFAPLCGNVLPRVSHRPLDRILHPYFGRTGKPESLPAPRVLPHAPPDFLRRILPIKPDNLFLKSFPNRRRDAGQALLHMPRIESGILDEVLSRVIPSLYRHLCRSDG